ncbi:unnamed protein product [Leptosia nina]|uniref:Lipase domain-containing protein n=1 Tax=Leptosia nina TaxID=320188 RepID=A0AAV1IVL3_9NEOP
MSKTWALIPFLPEHDFTRRQSLYEVRKIPNVWLSVESQDYGPGYGDEWLYYFDENNTRHIMNFSLIPRTTAGMLFGDAYFNLYTRDNRDSPERLTVHKSNDSLISSKFFNKANDVRVITHGWLSSDKIEWLQDLKTSLLTEYDLNVITVDWSELSENIFYPWAALSTRYVGKRVAQLLNAIIQTYDVESENIHLIGHSLGAQVMGYAGMFSNRSTFRITGLDPARPLFEIPKLPADFVLDKSDATFVDIIHTAAGTYGYLRSYGHADFYPNKGTEVQPGCGKESVCSHGRACVYFDESVFYTTETGFLSYPCGSWKEYENGNCKEGAVSMGYPAPSTARGNYYLRTRNESKFADM